MHTLPKLPYENNALEPYISAETIDFHHGKHLQAYVDNLNNLTQNTDLEGKTIEEILENCEAGPIKNNAGQVFNHTFYFDAFTPNPTEMSDDLREAIESEWGSIDNFQTEFFDTAMKLFGSGWVWLLVDAHTGKLVLTTTINGDTPLASGKSLMTCDVWEHSYYIDYRNARLKYLEAFWKVLDWEKISLRFQD